MNKILPWLLLAGGAVAFFFYSSRRKTTDSAANLPTIEGEGAVTSTTRGVLRNVRNAYEGFSKIPTVHGRNDFDNIAGYVGAGASALTNLVKAGKSIFGTPSSGTTSGVPNSVSGSGVINNGSAITANDFDFGSRSNSIGNAEAYFDTPSDFIFGVSDNVSSIA